MNQDGTLSYEYDSIADVLTIEGVRYSGALFRGIAIGDPRYWYSFDRTGDMVTVSEVLRESAPDPRVSIGGGGSNL